MKRKIIILIPSKIFLAIRNFYLGIFGVFMLEVLIIVLFLVKFR